MAGRPLRRARLALNNSSSSDANSIQRIRKIVQEATQSLEDAQDRAVDLCSEANNLTDSELAYVRGWERFLNLVIKQLNGAEATIRAKAAQVQKLTESELQSLPDAELLKMASKMSMRFGVPIEHQPWYDIRNKTVRRDYTIRYILMQQDNPTGY